MDFDTRKLDATAADFHHITNPHPHRPDADLSKFYVVTMISNPWRFERRYEYYWRFKGMCDAAAVKLITVELNLGHRPFMVTQPNNPSNIQLRTVEELWHKENALNLGIVRAAEMGAREVAWVDADCTPAQPGRRWFEETWHMLQHYEFVQMWAWLQDLNLNHNPLGAPQPSFMHNYLVHGAPGYDEFGKISDNGKRKKGAPTYPYPYGPSVFGRPGLAWAANVDALNKVGRLIDYCILGAADWYMAHALIGMLGHIQESSSNAYIRKLYQWQTLCERWIKRDVGCVPGIVYHFFHGRKQLRQYGTRGSILVENGFDPDLDMKYDSQGLLQLETWEPRQIRMRDQVRQYFRTRNEDSTTGGEE